MISFSSHSATLLFSLWVQYLDEKLSLFNLYLLSGKYNANNNFISLTLSTFNNKASTREAYR
ncbi:hypothetical protein B9J87_04935 [Vibrio sp. V19_P1S1T109]|nr:hypothetical protein B9J87_04935 [Vibrio sp. V19_P1S1T109]